MRRIFVLLACCMAAGAAQAQRPMDGDAPKAAKKSTAKPETKAPARTQTFPDRVRPPSQQQVTRPQDQRARESQRTQPSAIKPDRTRPADVYRPQKSAPSPAQQFQQQQFERREIERERVQPQRVQPQQKTVQQNRGLQCSAYPACARQPGGQGSCQGVVRTYESAAGARQDMVQRCIQANTPDSCNCAAQCARVAQCSKF